MTLIIRGKSGSDVLVDLAFLDSGGGLIVGSVQIKNESGATLSNQTGPNFNLNFGQANATLRSLSLMAGGLGTAPFTASIGAHQNVGPVQMLQDGALLNGNAVIDLPADGNSVIVDIILVLA